MIPDTIDTKLDNSLPHSKLGIASCVIAVLVFVYFFAAGLIGAYGLEAFLKDANALGALGIAFLAFLFHFLLCSIGFGIGIVLGLVSLTQKDKNRAFGIAGVILNALPLLTAACFIIYAFAQ